LPEADNRAKAPDMIAGLLGIPARFQLAVMVLRGWQRWGLAVLAGAVSTLAMAPFFLWPVLLVTLPILLWLIDSSKVQDHTSGAVDWLHLFRAAATGWCFAMGFHVVGLYWLREAFLVTGGGLALLWPLGVVGLPAYLALYHGAAAAITAAVPGPRFHRVLALALALTATEWLRGHLFTGFPWNILGLAISYPLVLAQTASVVGTYGLTLFAVVMLTGPAVLLGSSAASGEPRALRRGVNAAAAILLVPLAAMLAFGSLRMSAATPLNVDGVRIRLVQPSVPQRDKWLPEKQAEFLRLQIELSRRSPSGTVDNMAGITHVVWPEAALPFLPLQRPEVLAAIGQALPDGVHLLAGILRLERSAVDRVLAFNSLAAFRDDGQPVAIYDKTHLVPFGEYLPFTEVLEAIGLQALTRQRGGFATGQVPRPLLKVPGLPAAGPLICYEAVFPAAVVDGPVRPAFLLNVTNDGWFGNSTGPRQHYHQARMRAVEEGLPLLRVANNGITAAIDPFGRELARLDLDVAGVIDTPLPGALAPTPYARTGDLTACLLWLATLVALTVLVRTGRRHVAKPSQ
jgi:apolipoprotein N-acyltransferase